MQGEIAIFALRGMKKRLFQLNQSTTGFYKTMVTMACIE
jgi:hypothetical protein